MQTEFFSNCLFVCFNSQAQVSAHLIESANIRSREKNREHFLFACHHGNLERRGHTLICKAASENMI